MWSHTVPKRLLKQFAYDDPITRSPRMWRYTKGRPPSPVSPKSATRVQGYFADPNDPDQETRVETRLAYEIEDPVSKFISQFSDLHWTMNEGHRRQMTRYITLLFNRCTAKRAATNHSQEIKAYAIQKFLENETQLITVAAHWNINAFLNQVRLPRLLTIQDVAETAKRALVYSKSGPALQEGFVKSVVDAMAFFDDTMYRGIWNIMRTTANDPFILSDTPVVTWERLESGAFNYGQGFRRANVEVVLPISPSACLHILPDVERTRKPVLPTVREINSAQAAFSHQACFASTNSPEVNEIMQTFAHTVQLGRNAFTLWHRNFDNMFYDILMAQG
jgi:hypothetical protein